jgi:hypothetical protein
MEPKESDENIIYCCGQALKPERIIIAGPKNHNGMKVLQKYYGLSDIGTKAIEVLRWHCPVCGSFVQTNVSEESE